MLPSRRMISELFCADDRGQYAMDGANFIKANVVYMLQCADGTLYTGWTNDLPRRLKAHNDGTASKYTRSRRPVCVVYTEICSDKSAAMKREAALKKLSRKKKLALIEEQNSRNQ